MEPEILLLFAAALCAEEKTTLALCPTPRLQTAADALTCVGARVRFLKGGVCSVFPARTPARRPSFRLADADRDSFLFLAGFAAVSGGDVLLDAPSFSLSAEERAALTEASDGSAVFGCVQGRLGAASAVFGQPHVFRIPSAQEPSFTQGMLAGALAVPAGADFHFDLPRPSAQVSEALHSLRSGGAAVCDLIDGVRIRKGTDV